MILFLHGEDTYRMKEKLREIVEKYKKANKSCLNLIFFDGQKRAEDVFKSLKDGMRQTSIFEEKKLIIVSNVLENTDFKQEFLDNSEEFLNSKNITIFFQENTFNKNNALFNFLKKNAKNQEFPLLNGQKLKNWARNEFENQGAKIDNLSLSLLLDYVGPNLWRLSNEIQKLSNYKKGCTITKEDIELQVKPNIDTDIFKTIDAIAIKRKDLALNLMQKHLGNGDSPLYLFSMINYQFRNLLSVKDFIEKQKPYNAILKESGLHPFVVKKTYSLCRQFSFGELRNIYQKIFKTDFKIKTGLINPEAALDLLIAEI